MGSLWHCFNHITSGPALIQQAEMLKEYVSRVWKLGMSGMGCHGQSVVGQSMANQREVIVCPEMSFVH